MVTAVGRHGIRDRGVVRQARKSVSVIYPASQKKRRFSLTDCAQAQLLTHSLRCSILELLMKGDGVPLKLPKS
jgi:hypothetical protein